jgi:hypothetical protein
MVHLLSDLELTALHFALLLPDVFDIREQYRLAPEAHADDLGAYDAAALRRASPGTRALAKSLRITHPLCRGDGQSAPWILTTDLLITLRALNQRPSLLAVAVKPAEALSARRTCRLLAVEQAYWEAQAVPWMLLTP